MHISKITIRNYRNFKNATFKFKKGINTIIGENGSGKTNLFNAIRLLLEDSSLHYAYKLDETYFNRALSDARGHWIIISIEFDDLSHDEAIQSLFIHGIGNVEGGHVNKGSYNLFFRPKPEIRKKLSELKPGDEEGLEKIISNISIPDDYETFFSGKSTADFSDENTYKELVGDFDKVVFKYEYDESRFGVRIPHQLSIAQEISFTFIKALRDVVSDFHNNRTNPLLTLLKSKSGEIGDAADYAPIADQVKELNNNIEKLSDVQNIRNDVLATIKDAVGETYSPSKVSIKSSLQPEADRLLQSLKLFIGEPGESHEGGIHELSLGGANLIFLTLKLLEYQYQKAKQSFANFLIIEEPEAHIHTHIQKTIFNNLDYDDTQIIYSTHSTHIADVSNIENMNILAKHQNHAVSYQPANDLPAETTVKIQRYLDATRSNLLFAKGVVLVEGDAEEIVIPYLVKQVLGIRLDELGISLINIRSTGFENLAVLFHSKRINRRCSIITDLDAAICNTDIKAEDSEPTKKYKKKVKNSAEKGQKRQNALDKFIKDNKCTSVFYADHTFEVDFITAGNAHEAKELLPEIYTNQKTIEKSEADLNSSEVENYGKRILTMANQDGKGWFAIKLCNHIKHYTYIPQYIIDAILFIKPSLSKGVIEHMIQYRIGKNIEENSQLDVTQLRTTLSRYMNDQMQLSDITKELKKVKENDALLPFLSRIC